jgi:hypothetical protein
MEQLNEFQKLTETELKKLLSQIGCNGQFELAGGPREFALKVATGKYTSWIYPDGAGVLGGDVDERFEIFDYESLAALQDAYLTFLKDLLSR